MYRDGLYNQTYNPEDHQDASQVNYRLPDPRRHGELKDGGSPKSVDSMTSREKTVAMSAMPHIPHGEEQLDNLKQQLEDIEIERREDQARRRRRYQREHGHQKPSISVRTTRPESPLLQGGHLRRSSIDSSAHGSPRMSKRRDHTVSPVLGAQLSQSPRRMMSPASRDNTPTSGHSSSDDYYSDVPSSRASVQSPRSSRRASIPSEVSPLHKGLRDVRHMAGGIIHHPATSTDHYSILRHSHGLVFYQGVATAMTVSVFTDRALPADRAYLLKPKTWSITARNEATFKEQTSSLLNVTPTHTVREEQLDPEDERAWKRDIAEFEKRTSKGWRRKHVLRETAVIRIPPEVGDGYFQLVLCHGESETILCTSPTFRLLSISPTMGAVNGAHWSTLPLEIGAIALTMQAKAAIGTALLPMKAATQSKAQTIMPGSVMGHAGHAKTAGKLAYGATGAADKLATELAKFNENYHEEREGPFTPALKVDDDYENGPKNPYPINFNAKCDKSRKNKGQHIMPRSDLVNVPDIVLYRLTGYYFGWCTLASERFDSKGRMRRKTRWCQAIVVVIPVDVEGLERVNMSRANSKHVQLQLLADEADQPLHNEVVTLQIFGCIRPWENELEKLLAEDLKKGKEVAFDTIMANEASDIVIAQTILDEPSWHPEVIHERAITQPREKPHGLERLKEEYTEKRLRVQKKIDKMPLHKMGVRMPVDKRKDKTVHTNGYVVQR